MSGVSPLSLKTARGQVSALLVENQGAEVAFRQANRVFILTASDPAQLPQLIEALVPAGTKIDSSTAEVQVPMFLDRWDKYGFRFYYGPLTKPRDAKAATFRATMTPPGLRVRR